MAKLSFLPRVLNFRHSLYRELPPLQVMAKLSLPYKLWRKLDSLLTSFGETQSPLQVVAKLSLPYKFWRNSVLDAVS